MITTTKNIRLVGRLNGLREELVLVQCWECMTIALVPEGGQLLHSHLETPEALRETHEI